MNPAQETVVVDLGNGTRLSMPTDIRHLSQLKKNEAFTYVKKIDVENNFPNDKHSMNNDWQRQANTDSHPLKDTSRQAYIVLAAAVAIDAIAFCFPLSYGVFQEAYQHKFENAHVGAWIGVLANGITYLGAPLLTFLCERYSVDRRLYIVIGFLLCTVGLVASAFCRSIYTLIVTQGLIYGTGILCIEIPMLMVLNSWFDKRRGLAYGLIFAACDLLSVPYTFASSALLEKFDQQNTLLILAGMFVFFVLPGIVFIHENPSATKPERRVSVLPYQPTKFATTPKRYFQRGVFYVLSIGNVLQATAFFLPYIYLPSYAKDLGYTSSQAALVLAITNLAQVFGDIIFGKLSDKMHIKYLVIISTLFSSLAVILLWGFSRTLRVLLTFAVVYGTFGAGYASLWARMGTLFGKEDAPMVFSSMAFGRGIGSIISGPISAALVQQDKTILLSTYYQGGKYDLLILFIGICMGASCFMGVLGSIALWWNRNYVVVKRPDSMSRPGSDTSDIELL